MDFLKDLSIDKVRNIAEDTLNQVKPKTDVEARVYEVLSHKNWGSSSTLMNEIARDTYDYDRFPVVTRLMWEAMENQRPSAWRVVFKGLTLLEHLVKNGSERCVDDARNHGHVLRSLQQFNYYEGTIDRGVGVREKSKQLLEVLGDDDSIREERQKARKLREKFGGKLSTASSGGGGGSGSGYNQGGWESGGGYGEGGIGSRRDNSSYDNGGGYSGRYGGSESRGASSGGGGSTPTFATLPSENKTKKKVKKKTKKKDPAAPSPAAAPEVDLFSFDDPTPAAPAPAAEDDFAAFASAPAPAGNDASFDAFGTSAPAPAQTQPAAFDAFSTAPSQSTGVGNNAMAGLMPASGGIMANNAGMVGMQANAGMGSLNHAFGNMNMGQPAMGGMQQQQLQQPIASNVMGGGAMAPSPAAPTQAGGDDDEFGDFADAAPTPAKAVSSDPLSKLISLDGLSKNTKKEDKLSQPVVVNEAAAQFVKHQQELINQGGQQAAFQANAAMSFKGLDGLNNMSVPQQQSNSTLSQSSVMVSAGGSDAISSMMGPQSGGMNPQMMQQQQRQMNPQMMNMMGNQQGMMGSQQGMMNNNMMGNQQGMMNNNMMGNQQGMMNTMMANQQMGGNAGMQGNMGMQGGMVGMNPQMMMGGGSMMGNQQQMMGGMMNPNMQAGMGGMQQPMGGQMNAPNQMGGFR